MSEVFIVVRSVQIVSGDGDWHFDQDNIAAFAKKEDADLRVLGLQSALQDYRTHKDPERILLRALITLDGDIDHDGSYGHDDISWEVHTMELL